MTQIYKLSTVTRRDLTAGQQAVQSSHALAQFIFDHSQIAQIWFKDPYLAQLSVENEEDLLTNDYFVERGEATKKDLGNWIVVIPKSLNASKFYGCTSEWCTLFPDRFEYYSKYGDLNIFINKSKIIQLCQSSGC